MFESYTERARRVLAFAKYEASQMGTDTMQTEHLLLGLLRDADEMFLELLRGAAIEPDELRGEIEMRSTFVERLAAPVEIAISREAQQVLAFAVEERARLEHEHVGTEHLLLALVRLDSSMAGRLLAEKGLRLEALRAAVAELRRRRESAQIGRRAGMMLESVAKTLKLRPLPFLSADRLHLIDTSFGALLAALPVKLALLADRSGVLVSSLAELPPALAAWLEGAELDVGDDERRGLVCLVSPAGVPIYLSWVTGQLFLLVVSESDTEPARVRDAMEKLVHALAPAAP
ncbi:MAG: Clp protease N-terminal domain-containing protein [Acidobacteriota bacterium]